MDTRVFAAEKIQQLKRRIDNLGFTPQLVIIRIGDDKASEKYVANKIRRCEEVGIDSRVVHLHKLVDETTIMRTIKQLNEDSKVTAILLQLPIPKHLNEFRLTNMIFPSKDVDGFTVENTGKLTLGKEGNIPCTSRGIISILDEYGVDLDGKDVLIVNRSNIVGKPLAHLFLQRNATVTIAHSHTKNLHEKASHADVVVTGIGQKNFWKFSDFKDGAIVIDVAINFNEEGKMCGDIDKSDYDKLIYEKHCLLTPVPNGVGQMTVVELIE